jgi:hypothetical protein
MEHRTKKEEYIAMAASILGIVMIIVGLVTIGGFATSCSSSISTTQYQAEFEKAQPLSTFPPYAGEKKVIQIATLNVNKELWDMFPELRDKRVGMGVSNRIIENFEVTQRFLYAEEKEAIVNQMLDVWEKDLNDMGDGRTKLNVGSVVLPKYIVYAEIYEFSTTYGETYDKGKLQKTNTTIIGIQIKMVNVDNSQYIVASGQGTSTQVGEGFFKNPTMGFDQSTVGVATQRALEVATVNLMKRMDQYEW